MRPQELGNQKSSENFNNVHCYRKEMRVKLESGLEAECPECGEHLCVSVDRDRKSGKLKIVFWCEGAGDDETHEQQSKKHGTHRVTRPSFT